MPTYEYRCPDCHNAYEKREGFEAPALQECPTCGGTARRVLHAAPVVFKGSGFYVTDSRKPAPSEAEGSAPAVAGKSAPEAEAEAKVESPPEADERASAGKPSKPSEAGRDGSSGSSSKEKASKDAEGAAAS